MSLSSPSTLPSSSSSSSSSHYRWYGNGSNGTGTLGYDHTNDLPYLVPLIDPLPVQRVEGNDIPSVPVPVKHDQLGPITTTVATDTTTMTTYDTVPSSRSTVTDPSHIVSVYTSGRHTWFQDNKDELYVCGCNTYGQCGDIQPSLPPSTTATLPSTTTTTTTTTDTTISTNNLVLSPYQVRWSFTTTDPSDTLQLSSSLISTPLSNPVRIRSISCGWDHTALLTHEGYVYSFGNDHDGQCGTGRRRRRNTNSIQENGKEYNPVPTLVKFPPPTIEGNTCSSRIVIVSIACSEKHSLAVDTEGNIYGWGTHRHGLLPGINTSMPAYEPVYLHLPTIECRKTKDSGNKDIFYATRVCTGWNHSVAIDNHGYIITWGNNRYGQCGRSSLSLSDPDDDTSISYSTKGTKKNVSPIVLPGIVPFPSENLSERFPTYIQCEAISTGWHHTAVITKTMEEQYGQLYTWGRGDMGQLGRKLPNTDEANRNGGSSIKYDHRPTRIPLACSFRNNEVSSSATSSLSPPIAHIACGAESTYITLKCGCIYSCGWNEHSNLSILSSDTDTDNDKNQHIYEPTLVHIPNYSLHTLHRFYHDAANGAFDHPLFVCAGASTFLQLPCTDFLATE